MPRFPVCNGTPCIGGRKFFSSNEILRRHVFSGIFQSVIDHSGARCRRGARASGTTPGSGEQLQGKKLEPLRGKKFLICGIIKGDGAKTITDSTLLPENREFRLARIRPWLARRPTLYAFHRCRLFK